MSKNTSPPNTSLKLSRPASGWKRAFSFSVVLMLYTLVFFYLYATSFALLMGDPPHARFLGNSFNLIMEYAFVWGVLITVLVAFFSAPKLDYTKKKLEDAKSIFGLTVKASSDNHSPPTPKQRSLYFSLLGLLLLGLYSISSYIFLFLVFFQSVLLSQIKSGFDDSSEVFLEQMSGVSEILSFQAHPAHYVLPLFLVGALYYILVLNTWRGRGLPEVLSKTTVTEGGVSSSRRTQLLYIGVVIVLFIGAYPFARLLESTFPRNQESYERIISTNPQTEYRHPTGWSMQYDEKAMRISENTQWTSFLLTSSPPFGIGVVTVEQEALSNDDLRQFIEEYFQKNTHYIVEDGDNTLSLSSEGKDGVLPIIIEVRVEYNLPFFASRPNEDRFQVFYFFKDDGNAYIVSYEKYIDPFIRERVSPDIREHGESAVKRMIGTFRF